MSRGRASAIIGLIVSLIFVAVGVIAITFVLNLGDQVPEVDPQPEGADEPAGLTAKAFSDYTWDELAQIAALMEAASSDGAAREIAREYGLIDTEGNLTTETHQLVLDNGLTVDVRLVGMLHDTAAATGERAALTFMVSPIDVRRVNPTASSEGGWGSCELRTWLSTEGIGLFPDELAQSIVTVRKPSNNMGKSDTVEDITTSDDALWLFSCREVCGDITWLEDEFDYLSYGGDALLNAEGEQYEAFAREGVDQFSDSSSYLVMYYQGKAVPWWYRTPYAFEYIESDDDAFYQVTSFGYASAVNLADDTAGVVVGFCL